MFLHYLAKLQKDYRIIKGSLCDFNWDDRHYAHDLCLVEGGNLCYVGVNVC